MFYFVYHKADLDGYCCANIARKALGSRVELVPFNYEEALPIEGSLTKDDWVIFGDCVIQPYENMLKLKEKIGKLTVLDHHKSFIESEAAKKLLADDPRNIVLDIGRSGCQIAWDFFMKKERPRFVDLLGDWDRWASTLPNWESEIVPFQYAAREYLMDDPCGESWNNIDIDKYIKEGSVLVERERKSNKILMENSFDLEVGDLSFLCVNSDKRGSEIFRSKWNPLKYHYMLVFKVQNPKKWNFSVYTTRPDCDASEIAKKLGGGGHKGAAGFMIEGKNPWDVLDGLKLKG